MPILRPIRGTQLNLTHPLSRGLVGCWFADGSNSAFDYSRNGNNGTFAGDTYCVSGKFGYAWSFDGNGDYISIKNPVLDSIAMTVCAWVKKTAYLQYQTIAADWRDINTHRKWILGYENPENTITFYVGDGINADSQEISGFTANTWHFVCGVFDGNSDLLKIYLDNNSQQKTTTINNIGSTQTNYSFIGRYSSYYFNGQIDGVRIYNRALTPEEIRQLYIDSFCMFEDDSKISKKFL